MDDVLCDEDDTNILNCSATFMSSDCNHLENVWLKCRGKNNAVTSFVSTFDHIPCDTALPVPLYSPVLFK